MNLKFIKIDVHHHHLLPESGRSIMNYSRSSVEGIFKQKKRNYINEAIFLIGLNRNPME